MKKTMSILILSTLCVLATGCGVKGPLYFPAEPEQQTQPK